MTYNELLYTPMCSNRRPKIGSFWISSRAFSFSTTGLSASSSSPALLACVSAACAAAAWPAQKPSLIHDHCKVIAAGTLNRHLGSDWWERFDDAGYPVQKACWRIEVHPQHRPPAGGRAESRTLPPWQPPATETGRFRFLIQRLRRARSKADVDAVGSGNRACERAGAS
eukprot:359602-Chlamydomonas_euryale.AAC.6